MYFSNCFKNLVLNMIVHGKLIARKVKFQVVVQMKTDVSGAAVFLVRKKIYHFPIEFLALLKQAIS